MPHSFKGIFINTNGKRTDGQTGEDRKERLHLLEYLN